MVRTAKMMIIMALMTVITFCLVIAETVPSVSSAADDKFLSRMEKKQKLLTCMSEVSESITMASAEEKISSSSRKYIDRLEHKLGAVVKDSIKDVECIKYSPAHFTVNGNLTPELRSKVENIKKKIDTN